MLDLIRTTFLSSYKITLVFPLIRTAFLSRHKVSKYGQNSFFSLCKIVESENGLTN